MAIYILRRSTLPVLLLLMSSTPVCGQMSIWDFGGYAKNLIAYADGEIEWPPVDVGRLQNTTQLRLNLFMYPEDNFNTIVQTRTLIMYQENSDLLRRFQEELNTGGSYYFDLNPTSTLKIKLSPS